MKGSSDHPRVLIIDNDADNLLLLTQALHDEFSLVLAHDATRGWEAAHGDPAPAVILIDAALPGMNGIELCRRFSSEPAPLPVLVMAKDHDPERELQALKAGAADVLSAPLHAELVRLKLRRQVAWHDAPAPGKGAPATSGKGEADAGNTEIARLEAELERQKVALAEASSELQNFSYSVSHDLRAPLRHLIGFSSALLEDHHGELKGNALLYLDCIAKAGKKMEALVEALLTLSRVGAQEMSPTLVDLSFMARECAAALQSAEPQRQAEFRIQENLTAHADAPLMRTAMRQLMDNAFKFSGKKERTVISFGRSDREGGAFYVSDQGAGFEMQYAGRLFGPFQRLHQEGEFEGVGIGLAIVQRIIRRHGGRVWADAKVDEGATFYFTLPA